MRIYLIVLLSGIAVLACSSAEDPLETIGDVSVPDRLTGCVLRDHDGGSCLKAVCVADEESDCKAWVDACEDHAHLAGQRDGHDTCERDTSGEN